MRLAFSTLGCPGLPLAEVAALAARTGWTGLELRAADDEPVHAGLSDAQRRAARADLAGITVLCIATYAQVASAGAADDACIEEILAHAHLAADLGARAVRVFAGGDDAQADARAAHRLRTAAAELPEGVEIWLETHDTHPRGRDVARILSAVDDPRVRAVWDIAHPWSHGEMPEQTATALGPRLAHLQLKDIASRADHTPVLLGDGVLPLREALKAAAGAGYDGWLSLEWERKWFPAAAPLEQALLAARAWLDVLDLYRAPHRRTVTEP